MFFPFSCNIQDMNSTLCKIFFFFFPSIILPLGATKKKKNQDGRAEKQEMTTANSQYLGNYNTWTLSISFSTSILHPYLYLNLYICVCVKEGERERDCWHYSPKFVFTSLDFFLYINNVLYWRKESMYTGSMLETTIIMCKVPWSMKSNRDVEENELNEDSQPNK